MTATRRALLCAACAAAALVLARCSTNPVADGGTHTGNPDLVACVNAVYDVLATGDEWRADYYVEPERLDPSTIDPGSGAAGLTKRRFSPEYLGAAARDTIVFVDTILLQDTMLVARTVVRRDTIVTAGLVSDTTDTVINGAPASFIATSVRFDTVYTVDTLTATDTIYTSDTLYVQRSVAYDAAVDTPGVPVSGTDGNYFYLDSGTTSQKAPGQVVLAPAAMEYAAGNRSDTVSSTLVYSLSKDYVATDGARVLVQYTDADGNFTLFGASYPRTPKVLMGESRRLGQDRLELTCRFGPGADGLFATTSDNAIDSLVRYRYTGGALDEVVVLCGFGAASNRTADTATVTKYAPSDSLRRMRTVYRSESDLLVSLEQARTYTASVRGLDSLNLSLTALSKDKGGAIESATFAATLYLADGRAGSLTGAASARGLDGLYELDGRTYRVTSSGPGVVSESEILQ